MDLPPSRVAAADADAPLDLPASEHSAIEGLAREFMEKFGVPGLSLAVARQGRMVLQRGWGMADRDAGTPVQPDHLFRIASISKPITSAAVFSLIEQGRLGLDDLVFGERGLLKGDYGTGVAGKAEPITMHHLLSHTCGGWPNKKDDPMFLHPSMNHHDLIDWTLRHQALEHEPGTAYAYSNFGYCILGRVLEKLTGLSYAEVVQREVLGKCGIRDMKIAGNTLAERVANEVVYYGEPAGAPYGMNVSRMDSHGGWLATATDLVRFAMHMDDASATPHILKGETIRTMTTPGSVNPGYACGWFVNKIPNWWHGGSLPGTSTLLVRTAGGLCWAALSNIRNEGIAAALDRLMWKIVRAVPSWNA